jgi:N-acetylmuramic acid 6-phosphate etherase
MIRAAEGAEDNREAAKQALIDLRTGPNDVVIGLAASGRTPFAIAALDHARSVGALAIGIYNNAGGKLGEAADIPILMDTGPEFVAGSTRMKAGTAQKAALNCLSTGVMIKLGFVFRGKMVEMRATNEKLRGRAIQMVADLADAPLDVAERTLTEADGTIKLAVVMLIRDVSRAEGEKLLADANGILRGALAG